MDDESPLIDSTACVHEIAMADGESLRLTRVGSVCLEVLARGTKMTVMLTKVYLAPRLAENIVSYGNLESKGFALVCEGTNALWRGAAMVQSRSTSRSTATCCMLRRQRHAGDSAGDVIMAALEEREMDADTEDGHEASLLHWHQRLGHLAFDMIVHMARGPASGIRLPSKMRMACVSCLEGKQTRNAQSQKDCGANSPIDRIGGVICSDLKGR